MSAHVSNLRTKVLACGFALVLGLCAVALSTNASTAVADDDASFGSLHLTDFTEPDMGIFPTVQENARLINAGNRGCNSCHTSLFDTMKTMETGDYQHIVIKNSGYKNGTVNDCRWCHYSASGATGFLFSEIIHTIHFGSVAFQNANASCWNCHAFVKNPNGTGEYNIGDPAENASAGNTGYLMGGLEMVLWEDVMYTDSIGGYMNGSASGSTWVMSKRGRDTGLISGISFVANPVISLETSQEASLEEYDYQVNNLVRTDGTDPVSDESWMSDWTLTVSGLACGEVTLTLDDIKAMPATEQTIYTWCNVNGYNSSTYDAVPYKGVLLKDLIEALGGVAEGANAFSATAADGWNRVEAPQDLQKLIDDNLLLAYENWGHDMSAGQGGPLRFVAGGYGGGQNVKNLTSITFLTAENPGTIGNNTDGNFFMPTVNSSWKADDGVEFKLSDGVVLEGNAWGFRATPPAQLEFSIDFGNTTQVFDISDNFDPNEGGIAFTFTWMPEQAGTYIIKVRTIAATGEVQHEWSNVIVNVVE